MMIKLATIIKIVFLLFIPIISFSQYYDIGLNTNYIHIEHIKSTEGFDEEIIYTVNDSKKIKKVFNKKGELLEELVIINDTLKSGIEYFTNSIFPFFPSPRFFEIQEIEHNVSNYENVKFSASLIKYLPKRKKGIFRVRLYNNNNEKFYVLITNQGPKIYFKAK